MAGTVFPVRPAESGPRKTPALVRHAAGFAYLYLTGSNQMAGMTTNALGQAWSQISLPAHEVNEWMATWGGGLLHIVASLSGGGLVHWQMGEHGCREQELAFPRPEWAETTPLFLGLTLDQELILLFLAQGKSLDQWYLGQCKWADPEWTPPSVIAEYRNPEWNTAPVNLVAQTDAMGMVHVIYGMPTGGYSRLYHRILRPSTNWDKAFPISDSAPLTFPAAMAIDCQNGVHVLWVDARAGEIKYRRRQPGGWPYGGWQEELTIACWAADCFLPSIVTEGEAVLAVWKQGAQLCGNLSYNRGISWGQPFAVTEERKMAGHRLVSNPADGFTGSWVLAAGRPPEVSITPRWAIPHLVSQERMSASLEESGTAPPETAEGEEQDLGFFIQQHNDYFQRMAQQVEDLKKTNRELGNSLLDKTREAAMLSGLYHHHEEKTRTLAQQMLIQSETIKQMETSLEFVLKDREELEDRCRDLADGQDEAATGLRQASALLAEKEHNYSSLEIAFREKEDECLRLEKALKDNKSRLSGVQALLEEKEEEIKKLREALEELESMTLNMDQLLSDKEAALIQYQGELEQAQCQYQEAIKAASKKKPSLFERLTKTLQ